MTSTNTAHQVAEESEDVPDEYESWVLIKCGTPSIYRSDRPGRNRLYALDFGGNGKVVYQRPDLLHFGRMLERLAKTGRA